MAKVWTQAGGRFINGKVSVSIDAAYDYVTAQTKEKTMEDLEIDEDSYDDFRKLVCKKLSVNRIHWPKGFKL